MKQLTLFINLVILLQLTLIYGEDAKTGNEASSLEPIILNKLLRPTDTDFEKEAKKLIAQYLLAIAEQTNVASDISDSGKQPEPVDSEVKHSDSISNEDLEKGRQETVTTATAAPVVAETVAPVTEGVAAATQGSNVGAVQVQTTPSSNGVTFRPGGPSQGQILGQVNKILQNVYQGNVSGIIDQSLGIRNNTPVRNLVNGIIGLVLCYPWDRILGRCPGQQGATA